MAFGMIWQHGKCSYESEVIRLRFGKVSNANPNQEAQTILQRLDLEADTGTYFCHQPKLRLGFLASLWYSIRGAQCDPKATQMDMGRTLETFCICWAMSPPLFVDSHYVFITDCVVVLLISSDVFFISNVVVATLSHLGRPHFALKTWSIPLSLFLNGHHAVITEGLGYLWPNMFSVCYIGGSERHS